METETDLDFGLAESVDNDETSNLDPAKPKCRFSLGS